MNRRTALASACGLAALVATAGAGPTAARAAASRCEMRPLATSIEREPLKLDLHAGYGMLTVRNRGDLALDVRGSFPHAAYMSFTTYTNGALRSTVLDRDIQPDAGSVNPFRSGAPVSAPNRAFRLRIAPRGSVAARTGGSTLDLPAGDLVTIFYRVYQPDPGYSRFGGALPAVTPVSASDPAREAGCEQLATSPEAWLHFPAEIQGILPFRRREIPRPDPTRVMFFRPPNAAVSFPDGTPELAASDPCSGYLTAGLDPSRLAVLRIERLPTFFDNGHPPPGGRFPETDLRYLSLQAAGAGLTGSSGSLAGPEIRTVAGAATFVAIPATYGPILRATVRAIAASRGYNAIDQAASGLLYDSMLIYRNKVPAAGFTHTTAAPPCYRGADWSKAPAAYASSAANMGPEAIGGVECSYAEFSGAACDRRLRASASP